MRQSPVGRASPLALPGTRVPTARVKSASYPARIVCLSAESADICARIGAWERVVGVSAYADQATLPRKPVIGGFSEANVQEVLALQPDLIFTFSDVQAEIAAE